MKRIQKRIALALVLAMLLSLLTSCISDKSSADDNTLSIVMGVSGVPIIMPPLQEKFPDINFVVEAYAGCNTSYYQKKELMRGEGGDIFFYTTFYNANDAAKYLVDLSGYSFLANYDKAILSTMDVNGAIYQIPGPITVRYLILNKSLFEEKGWKIPENFDELVAVCKQIHTETPEIAPLGLGTTALGFVFTLITSYAQMGYLNTAQGQEAKQRYLAGEGSFGDAFDEGLDMVGQLIDAGAFMPERFAATWEVTPTQMCSREAAMCFVMGASPLQTELLNGGYKGNPELGPYNNDDFIVLPMFGKNASNKGLIMGTSNTWGLSKYLEEKGNEKKLENALRVLEYIASEEGQLAIRNTTAAIPALKELKSNDIPQFMRELWGDPTNSIRDFFLYTGYEHMMAETAQVVYDAMAAGDSTGMKEEVIRIADQLNDDFLHKDTSSAAFGRSQDDLNVEETRWHCCEAFRIAAGADAAMASEAGIKNSVRNLEGLAGRLFKGDITSESISVLIAQRHTNVVHIDMRGNEIRELVENGKRVSNENGEVEMFTYWTSGIEAVKKGDKSAELTLNGRPIEDDAVYTVAMINEDYSEDFAQAHEIFDTGIDIEASLIDYFTAQKTISAKQ